MITVKTRLSKRAFGECNAGDELDSVLEQLRLSRARHVWRDLVGRADREGWPHEDLLRALFIEELGVGELEADERASDAVLQPRRPLSPREREVLDVLLRGHSEKRAADRLGLSSHTVHQYVKRLFRAFGVSSRAELMAGFIPRV
jgi:DNA-binding CsgD family transcriptional regulator